MVHWLKWLVVWDSNRDTSFYNNPFHKRILGIQSTNPNHQPKPPTQTTNPNHQLYKPWVEQSPKKKNNKKQVPKDPMSSRRHRTSFFTFCTSDLMSNHDASSLPLVHQKSGASLTDQMDVEPKIGGFYPPKWMIFLLIWMLGGPIVFLLIWMLNQK